MTRSSNVVRLVALAGAAVGLGACVEQSQTKITDYAVPRPFVRPPVFDPGTRPVTQPLMLTQRDEAAEPVVIARQRFTAPTARDRTGESIYAAQPGEVRRVKIAVNSARIDEVLRAVLGPDGLDRSYVLAPELQQAGGSTVTLDIDEEMTNSDLMDLLGGLGSLYGWTIEERGEILYVAPIANMARSPVTPIMETRAAFGADTPAIRVRQLRYLSATDAQAAIGDLVSEGGKVVAVGDTLLIVDTLRQTNRLSTLLASLDVPEFEGVEIWTYQLASRTPESASSLLKSIIEPTGLGGQGAADARVAFVAIPGTRNLMVISRDPSVHPYIRDLVSQIDSPDTSEQRFRYLYRIQYYDPQALVSMIEEFFAEKIEGGGSQRRQGGAGSVAGAAAETGVGGAGAPIRLVLDENENILLIYATPTDYADLLGTLRMVDRPRQQVSLSSIIAEVSLRDELEYGVEYFLEALNADGIGILELAGGASDLLTAGAPTGAAFLTGGSGFAVIQAIATETDVNILSQPKLTVRDKSTATINVGGETPVPEGDIDTQTGGLRRDISYRPIGVTLEIEPDINESGDVTLRINQEIAAVQSQGELGPEFTTRVVETTVTVPHGKTLLIGGIIERDTTVTKRKIPLLGDIPGVGAAFTSQQNLEERRELLLAITPTIINSPNQGVEVMGEFLRAARGVERALHESVDDLDTGVLNFDQTVPEPLPRPPGVDPTIRDPFGLPGDPQSSAAPAPAPAAPPPGPVAPDPVAPAPAAPPDAGPDRWAIAGPTPDAALPVVWTPTVDPEPRDPRWSLAALISTDER